MPTRVTVLGAGFGGLELSARLTEELGDDVHITLIDQSDAFVFGFSKLDVMFGHRTFDEVRLPYREIAIPGVEFHQESIVSIDPHDQAGGDERAVRMTPTSWSSRSARTSTRRPHPGSSTPGTSTTRLRARPRCAT